MATVTMFEGVELVTFSREDAAKLFDLENQVVTAFKTPDEAFITSTSGFFNAPVEKCQLLCATLGITLTGKTFIGAYQPLMDLSSEVDVLALLYHERGHAHYEHLVNASEEAVVNGIILNDDWEVEADAYAASKVGKDVMRAALINILDTMFTLLGMPEELKARRTKVVLTTDHMVKRLTALS